MRRSSQTKQASTKFVENQESTVLEQLQDQQADAEMAMKKEADKRQQQRDRMKKRRATDALGDASELRRNAVVNKHARADELQAKRLFVSKNTRTILLLHSTSFRFMRKACEAKERLRLSID